MFCAYLTTDNIRSKALVSPFPAPVGAQSELQKRQKQMNLPNNALIDVAIRLKRTYDSFLRQRLPVYTILYESVTKPSDLRKLDESKEQWHIIEAMVPVSLLVQFNDFTDY